MTVFGEWLMEQAQEARDHVEQSKDHPNSYGHGYDHGLHDGLGLVIAFLQQHNLVVLESPLLSHGEAGD